MKKNYIVVQKKNVIPALDKLRELGAVHVEHQEPLKGYDLNEFRQEVDELSKVVEILRNLNTDIKQEKTKDWHEPVGLVLERMAEIEKYEENINKRKQLIQSWEPWGDFDPKDIKSFEEKGMFLLLLKKKTSDKKNFPREAIVKKVFTEGGYDHYVVILNENKDLPFEKIIPPALSLSSMKSLQKDEQLKIEYAQKEIYDQSKYLQFLEEQLAKSRNALMFEEVATGMKKDEELSILKGFCPVDDVQKLQEKAVQEHWGLVVEEPTADDQVPTLVKNSRWVEIIKPLYGVINVLPGYREQDISIIFLIFFSVFVGILVGDAGYGAIIMALTLFCQFKFRNSIKDYAPFFLMYVLSGCIMVWGILSGTVFGTLLFSNIVKPVIAWLADVKNIQMLCFLLGAVHLTIAHGWRMLMSIKAFFTALAEFGWIVVIWGAFFLANDMVLGSPLLGMDTAKSLIIIGVGAVCVIADIISRPKDGIATNLVLVFFSFISAFTDVVSYIRLFAVGLAGVAVADAFNEMALSIGFGSLGAACITVVMLVVGHLFNLVLCGFGILVHGLRLNVLEFSGHLGLQWAGFKYEPFKKINQQ